jgi:coenzyme F420-reducing hydrogenase alpha subunit
MDRTVSKSSQDFVPVKEIREGIVILKDGSMQMILMASSLNFALKSRDEQLAILTQYQNFLNSLDFTIQILIQSKKLDIKPYLATIDERIAAQTEDLLKIQTREYKEFIKKFTETVNIMSKSFFVVIPYNPPTIQISRDIVSPLAKLFGKTETNTDYAKEATTFEENRTQLEQRANVVTQGLARIGVRTIGLGTEELIELFYRIFNPEETTGPVGNK